MIFRAALFLSFIGSTSVVAFAPHAPASAVVHQASARRSVASSWELASEIDSTSSEVEIEDTVSENDKASSVEEEVLKPEYEFALLFDCDGVILETEELHRLAYNAAFKEFEVTKVCGDVSEPVEWSVGYYDILQNSIGGGKPKMRHYFSQLLRFESNENGDPTKLTATIQTQKQKRKQKRNKKKANPGNFANAVTIEAADIATGLESLIDAIQTRKTELYKTTVEQTATPRPGLLNLMDEALADKSIAVGVCSASTKAAAQKVLECTLGPERVEKLDVCILGDDVSEKKPSPLIYNTARDRLGIDTPERCVVVEDSAVGLRAAKAAGMRCLITYTESTTNEDFYGMGADAKVPDLVNNGNPVTLDSIFDPLRVAYSSSTEDFIVIPELLVGLKDDPVPEVEEEVYDEDDNLVLTPIAASDEDIDEDKATPEEAESPLVAEADLNAISSDEEQEVGEENDEDATTAASEEEVGVWAASSESATVEEVLTEEAPPAAEEPAKELSSSTDSDATVFEPAMDEEEPEPTVEEPEEPLVEEEPAIIEEAVIPAATAEEVAPAIEPPAVAATPPPRRMLKAKMVQDDMGNFSM